MSKLPWTVKIVKKNHKLPKLSKIILNCHKLSKKSKNCQNVGQVVFLHHSHQMSQRSQVSGVCLWMWSSKVLSQPVTEWQGHLLTCSGQLKIIIKLHFILDWVQDVETQKISSPFHLNNPLQLKFVSNSPFQTTFGFVEFVNVVNVGYFHAWTTSHEKCCYIHVLIDNPVSESVYSKQSGIN